MLRLFSSKTRVDLLALFFSSPTERYYVRQIARQIGHDISGIKRELDNLERAGLLTSEKVGNLRYYAANKGSAIYSEIKSIVAKTVGAQGSIREALHRVKGLESAILYSTNAHLPGEGPGPIELLIIGQVDLDQVNDAITTLEGRLAREINYTVFDPSEFKRRKAEEDPFVSEILRGKRTVLIGREDGL